MDDIYTQLATDYLNNQVSNDSTGQPSGQNVSPIGQTASAPVQNTPSTNQLAPDDVYESLAKDYLEKNPQAVFTPTDSGQTAPLPDAAYTQLATEHLAQTGELKKDDLDSYFDLVKSHALDPNYDPANQTAQDKVNGIDSRDYNFDIYNARYNQGFQTDTPWTDVIKNGVENAIPGLVHAFGDASFWNRLGESAYQASPYLLPGGIPLQGILNQVSPGSTLELPSLSGRNLKQNVAELGAAVDTATNRMGNSLMGLADAATGNASWNFKNLTPEQQQKAFDNKVSNQVSTEEAARGEGATDKLLGIGRYVKDVEGVKDAADFAPINPLNVGLMLAAGPIGELTSAAGEGLAGALPESWTASNAGAAGLKGLSYLASPVGVGAATTGIQYYRNRDFPTALLEGVGAGLADWEAGGKVQGKLSDLADYVKGNAPEGYVPPSSIGLASKAWNAAKTIAASPEAKTGLGGALYSIPLALAEDDPNQQKAVLANGLAAGVGLGTLSRLGGLLDARYAASQYADFYKNLPTTPSEYGTPYDGLTADSVSRMSLAQKYLLFRQRNVMGANGQLYVVPDDKFQGIVQPQAQAYFESLGHDPETAANLAQNVSPSGIYYGADSTGVPRIFIKESAFNVDNVTHEMGHFISDTIYSNIKKAQQAAQVLQQNGQPITPEIQSMLDMGKQLDAQVPTGQARIAPEQGYIKNLYNLDKLQNQIDDVQTQVNNGDEGAQDRLNNLNNIKEQFEAIHKNGLPDNVFKNEWLAEQFSLAARGLMSEKQAGWGHTLASGIGSFLDSASPGAVSQYLTTRQTPLGFRPSFIAADVFDHWIGGRAAEIKAEHPDWKPNPPNQVSANNAPTEPPGGEPPSGASPPPPPIAPIVQPNGKVVQDATDALIGLKVFGKKAVAGKVSEAIESLRSQGVDISQIKPIDIVAEATKGRGQTPTEIAKQQEQTNPTTNPLPKASTNPPLQWIEPGTASSEPTTLELFSKTPPKPVARPLSEIDPNGFVDAQELAQGDYLNPSGLKRITSRSLNKKDLTVNEVPENGLVGQRIDPTQPLEAALLRQGAADSDNPEVFGQSLAAIEDAIANKKTLSISYNSAENNLEGTPSSQNRGNAQDASDKGFVNRSPTPKTINPTSIEVLRKNEPYFDNDSKAVALQTANDFDFKGKKIYKNAADAQKDLGELYSANAEGRMPDLGEDTDSKVNFLIKNFVPKEFKTRFYANSFSFDKMAGNKNLFQRAIVDSDLQNDPLLSKVQDYLKSERFIEAEKGRLLNSANGFRGDGQLIEGSLVKPTPGYKPFHLDDFETQVFNALEGGPSATYFEEANQNVPQLRGIKVNPKEATQGANPLWNHLLKLGDKVKVFEQGLDGSTIETNGIKNIFSPATELVRLDRINNINVAPDAQQMPTSKYGNRAIGFTPGSLKRIDQTINPAIRNRMYQLQGIAGATSERKPQ